MIQLPLVGLLHIPLVEKRKGSLVGKGEGRRKVGTQVPAWKRFKSVLLLEMVK